MDQSPHLNSKKVFEEKDGKFLIGGEEITKELRDILREQAKYLVTSQLFEVLINTAKNESIQMGLVDSTNWDHVLSAKALRYWSAIFTNLVNKLKQ